MDTATKILTIKQKRQKAMEQELSCNFITIDPDKIDITIFRAIIEIFRHIKQSTKKPLINKISTKLLRLKIKSVNIMKSKAMKFIMKKYYLTISIMACFYLSLNRLGGGGVNLTPFLLFFQKCIC